MPVDAILVVDVAALAHHVGAGHSDSIKGQYVDENQTYLRHSF